MSSRIPNSYYTNFPSAPATQDPATRLPFRGEPPIMVLSPEIGLNEQHTVTTRELGIRIGRWEGRNTAYIGEVIEDVEGVRLSGRHTFPDSVLDRVPVLQALNPNSTVYLGIPPNNPQKYVPVARALQSEQNVRVASALVLASPISHTQRPDARESRSSERQRARFTRQWVNAQQELFLANRRGQHPSISPVRVASPSSDSSDSVVSGEAAHIRSQGLHAQQVSGSRMQLWSSSSSVSSAAPLAGQTEALGAEITAIFSRQRGPIDRDFPPTRPRIERSVRNPTAVPMPRLVNAFDDAVSGPSSSSASSTSSTNTHYWQLAQASYNRRMLAQASGNHHFGRVAIPASARSGTSSPVILGPDMNGQDYLSPRIDNAPSQGVPPSADQVGTGRSEFDQVLSDVSAARISGETPTEGQPRSLSGSPEWGRLANGATLPEQPLLRSSRNAVLTELLRVHGSPGIVRVRNTGISYEDITQENSRNVARIALMHRLNGTLPGQSLPDQQQWFVDTLNVTASMRRDVQAARSGQNLIGRLSRNNLGELEQRLRDYLRGVLNLCSRSDVFNFGQGGAPSTNEQLDRFVHSEQFRIFVEAINHVFRHLQNVRPHDNTRFAPSPAPTDYFRRNVHLMDTTSTDSSDSNNESS